MSVSPRLGAFFAALGRNADARLKRTQDHPGMNFALVEKIAPRMG